MEKSKLELEILNSLTVKKSITFEDSIDPLFLFTTTNSEGQTIKQTYKEMCANMENNVLKGLSIDELIEALKK
jgi:hypothetical protein